jgi:hypothetical protein
LIWHFLFRLFFFATNRWRKEFTVHDVTNLHSSCHSIVGDRKGRRKNTSRITRTPKERSGSAQPHSKLLILSIDLATLGLALGNPVGQFFRDAT